MMNKLINVEKWRNLVSHDTTVRGLAATGSSIGSRGGCGGYKGSRGHTNTGDQQSNNSNRNISNNDVNKLCNWCTCKDYIQLSCWYKHKSLCPEGWEEEYKDEIKCICQEKDFNLNSNSNS